MATQNRPLPAKDKARRPTNRTIEHIFNAAYVDRAFEDGLTTPDDGTISFSQYRCLGVVTLNGRTAQFTEIYNELCESISVSSPDAGQVQLTYNNPVASINELIAHCGILQLGSSVLSVRVGLSNSNRGVISTINGYDLTTNLPANSMTVQIYIEPIGVVMGIGG